jgi:hypothetical protein
MSIMSSAKEKREWHERRQRQLKHSRKLMREYGVWHPDDGLIFTSVSRELCNSHINDALMDAPVDEYAKALRIVEVTYFHPTKMHGEE